MFRLLNKLLSIYNKYYSKNVFSKVNCDVDSIIIGPDCNTNFTIKCPENFRIDKGTVINGYCYIQAYGGVSIGQYCHIGKGLTIFSHNHNYNSTKSIPYDDVDILKPVVIMDFVWCGSNVTIVPGITIGEGAVIGSGSIVTRNIPDCAVVGGNPAKIIKYRNLDEFYRLKKEGKYF